ncbi:hypothetical protein ACLIYM_05460 [Streptomyces fenghuangensis]|uniref:hypothetical protein n=1 Tax=Streptomyces sp. ICN903 TaxID=2964654 RepID=UPI001EDA79AC|nr:hypothetical protein [Streptomyces sp. ICN903]MCG3040749.1 hypothetical protein [Streptomyces sp. ICN903]
MRKTTSVLTSWLLLTLTACGAFTQNSGSPMTPIPDSVPSKPLFRSTDELLTALGEGGVDCEVLRRREGGLDCMAEIDGVKVGSEISVFDTEVVEEGEIGRSITSRRKEPYSHTLVAAGNWYIRVLDPAYAPQVAEALDAVVLPPLFPLPDIPKKPRYKDLDSLADALDASVGCERREREKGAADAMTCVTERSEEPCAYLELHDTSAERDDALRLAISVPELPRFVVTAGNWSIQFCDRSLGREAADDLGGVVVS